MRYEDFVDTTCEILGLKKPIDIIKLCQITDEFIEPYQSHIDGAETRLEEYEKEVKKLKSQIKNQQELLEKQEKKLNQDRKRFKELCELKRDFMSVPLNDQEAVGRLIDQLQEV